MKTIAIANNKGGVSKSSSTLCLADALSEMGRRVLVVDMDPQCNTTSASQGETEDVNTMYDILKKECTLKEAIQNCKRYDLVPNDPLLSGRESDFTGQLSTLKLLKKELSKVSKDYDYAVIDTPPNLGFYMVTSLLACDGVIMPLDAKKFAVDGISQLVSFIKDEIMSENDEMQIYGALITQADYRYAETSGFVELLPELGEQNGFRVFNTVIRTCSDIQKAQNNVVSLYDYNRSSKAVKDYEALAEELEEIING